MKQCPDCRSYMADDAQYCPKCGHAFSTPFNETTPPPCYGAADERNNAFDACTPDGKSRGIAALLAIFLGGLGIQYFYLGKTSAGLITIGLSLITCGLWEIVTFIQGILMFFMTNAQFREKYVETTSSFPLF